MVIASNYAVRKLKACLCTSPEAMLFIEDHQTEVVELNILTQQAVRTHSNIYFTEAERFCCLELRSLTNRLKRAISNISKTRSECLVVL